VYSTIHYRLEFYAILTSGIGCCAGGVGPSTLSYKAIIPTWV
jgi:hypothetical protein